MNYTEYLEKWMDGIPAELSFWDEYMKKEGGLSFYGFEKTVAPNRKFELENDIPKELFGHEYRFLDVGSGPFSRCGVLTDLVQLDAVAMDPLAYAYEALKKKYNLDNGISLKHGFVETLHRYFKANSFDMVHMSNSLDHCFSALDGIYQLLNVCKIGGKVILRHHENEAENEHYLGMHQWNLSLHNAENSFVIWRGDIQYDVCKIFEEYASFELVPDEIERDGYWIYNKVVMTKLKDVELPERDYSSIMLDEFYKKLLLLQLRKNENKWFKKEGIGDIRISKIRSLYHKKDKLKSYLVEEKINKVIIYGMGYVGKNLSYLLESMQICVIKLDMRRTDCGCKDAVTLEECPDWSADRIVLTVEDIIVKEELCEKAENVGMVLFVDDFLDYCEVKG